MQLVEALPKVPLWVLSEAESAEAIQDAELIAQGQAMLDAALASKVREMPDRRVMRRWDSWEI